MNCLVCRQKAIERNGKFGTFYFCPGHGTISQQGRNLKVTGLMFLKVKKYLENKSRHFAQAAYAPNLEILVEQKMASMGFFMDDLDRFVEGCAETALDEEDHWMNLRPH